MESTDYTAALARELHALGPGSLTEADRAQLSRLLLDFCGVAYGGTDRPWIVVLHAWAKRYGGTGGARIVASDLSVAPAIAALVNGAAGHSFELDDTHDASMSHPGAVVFPAALAVAAETGSTADAVLAAVTAGYETMARLGRAAAAGRVMAAGFHPTALFGAFGAATAAAKLTGLDADGLSRAWGHALSMTAGSVQFSQETAGAEVKRMHAGYAAHNGVLAAEFAAAGIEAPRRALDGRYGFLSLYGQEPDPAELTRSGPRAIGEISFKPYACCRLLHSMIDGLRDVTDGFRVTLDAVRSIRVTGPGKLAEQHMVMRPTTPMAAQYSLPFTVGATLAFGPERFDAFDAENLGDPSILAWTGLVEVGPDPELEQLYPAHFGTETTLTLASGETRTARVLDSRGTAANPMPLNQVRDKARGLIGQVSPGFDFAALQTAIGGFHGSASAAALGSALGRPSGTQPTRHAG